LRSLSLTFSTKKKYMNTDKLAINWQNFARVRLQLKFVFIIRSLVSLNGHHKEKYVESPAGRQELHYERGTEQKYFIFQAIIHGQNFASYLQILPTWAKFCQLIANLSVVLLQINLTKLKLEYLKFLVQKRKTQIQTKLFLHHSSSTFFRVQLKFAFRIRPSDHSRLSLEREMENNKTNPSEISNGIPLLRQNQRKQIPRRYTVQLVKFWRDKAR